MRGSRSTQGATLVVVVLLTMLLLAALLAASSQLTLSSRRTVADQRATLQAQYVAESGVALAQSRLRDVQNLLTRTNLVIPYGTTASTIKSYAEKYCASSTWVAKGTTRSCTVQESSADDQFEIFARFVSDSAYARLPTDERPTTLTDKRAFWKKELGTLQQIQANGATIFYRLAPTRVDRLDTHQYRFYLQLETLTVRGDHVAATRVLRTNRSRKSNWWIDISLPSYLDNVLFTNHHASRSSDVARSWSPNVEFNNQIFDGPVHTNERFLFTPNATAEFKGKLSSAGCINLQPTGLNADKSCTQEAGFYSNGLKRPDNPNGTDEQQNNSLISKLNAATDVKLAEILKEDGTPSGRLDVNFRADYRPMPENNSDQRAAAKGEARDENGNSMGRGLYFDKDVRSVVLAAGNWSRGTFVPPSTYNPRLKRWEPESQYQFIQVTDDSGRVTTYRADKDRRLERLDGGTWKLEFNNFNGVLFGEKTIAGLTGPGRDKGNPLPALASFSQITVAAQKDVEIDSDLTLSDVPCHPTESSDEECRKQKRDIPQNVLGIYTQKGDVIISKDAPNNLNLHAMLMSSEGEVRVDGFDTGSPRGTVNLLGGLVENWYGAFGKFNPMTRQQTSGYIRNFSYDRRFQDPGFTPPFFPISPTWIKKDGNDDGLSLENFVVQQGSQADLP